MPFKGISYLELWRVAFVQKIGRFNLCNCGSRHYEDQFCEIILHLDK